MTVLLSHNTMYPAFLSCGGGGGLKATCFLCGFFFWSALFFFQLCKICNFVMSCNQTPGSLWPCIYHLNSLFQRLAINSIYQVEAHSTNGVYFIVSKFHNLFCQYMASIKVVTEDIAFFSHLFQVCSLQLVCLMSNLCH